MRWGWLVLALVLVGCGGSDKKRPTPPPMKPVLAIVHADPETFVGGGQLRPGDIERRELRCGRPGNLALTMELPESGRVTLAEFRQGIPGLSGELQCASVVYVDGVVSPLSNRVSLTCDAGQFGQRCWQRE